MGWITILHMSVKNALGSENSLLIMVQTANEKKSSVKLKKSFIKKLH